MADSGIGSHELLSEYLDVSERSQFLKWQQRKYNREGNTVAMESVANELRACQKQNDMALSLIGLFNGYESTLLRLRYVEGMSVREIADSSELPYGYDWISHKLSEERRSLELLDRWKAAQA
ncbi:hypothetical protein [Levilactobacillus enshiensis]|uniref:hypothetical protein n=1 Tax=Levilactobacillus enshiensis TaxID=2590213 RepID=UPI001179CF84|nr:hypothetical protein [Levilactobacillus enshiensis]